ncbi:hypothetical protein DB30_00089 [Enhygromyxa salina]|uniref:NACHT domain-containing protein n=1 Tax=Enhygromyxa salina TaxID=215803 RepID=A0A0C2DDQ6_9BACT|nr:ATP-binding protein [Enhygromyxa salina]KIG19580.1 hypothetical protein DB30_00089 [Enhygromyxa salina]
MATLTPDQHKDIALTVGVGERLTLIFVVGPSYLAAEGLAEVQELIGASASVVQHRLDRLGPDIARTIASVNLPHPVVLVSGLERMAAPRREQLLASMNLLRDTLNQHPAVVVMWVPVELADEFRRLCVDLFQWRALTVYVDGPQHDIRRLRHDYLVSLVTAEASSPPPGSPESSGHSPANELELWVRVAGEDEPTRVERWLESVRRGLLVGAPGSGKTTALRRHAARQAASLLDDSATIELPVFVAARLLPRFDIDWPTLSRAAAPSLDDEARSWLTQHLSSAPTLLLIDALDEDLSAERATQISALADSNAQMRVVMSGRALSQDIGGWQRAELLPLQPAAIATWLDGMGIDLGTDVAWASTPHLLQLVASFARERGRRRLLDDLTELIAEVVGSQLGRRDMDTGVLFRPAWSITSARTVLSLLAAELTDSQAETVSSRSPVLEYLAQHSTLVHTHSIGPDARRYGFTHRIFLDYFAGLWLAASEFTAELAGYAADPTWQPATRHALAMLAPGALERTADAIWDAAEQEPAPMRWSMRALVLRVTIAHGDRNLRARFMKRATSALDQAQRDAEPEHLWAPIAELLARANQPPT